ncbi:PREDICTED: transcription factor MYB98-like [Fragaria vesca subsp. vesca]|uniref:transcription factor MYB98-like n=1 Tax=Fragaria vesca subsp. vesca TaxID=101020 RepID=UPI0002C30A52|nr:PREDICTED: transcription factor MYB98-like [Fragaria vesca subsp. vesca]
MEFRDESGFPLLSSYFSGAKQQAPPESLNQNSRFYRPPSSPHGNYKPNTLYNNHFHFQNQDRGIDLNYSDQYHHTSPLLGGTTIEGSSSNPFGGVDLPTIEGFSPFDACYNHPNDVNVFPYASAAAVSFSDSQKAVMHGGWEDYDDEDLRHRHPHNHHHQMSSVAQEGSCVQLPPLINYQDIESAAPRVMRPAVDEYSCNMAYMEHDQLSKKKRYYVNKASKQQEDDEGTLIKGQWTEDEDRLLAQLVQKNGMKKWSLIAAKLNGRVGKQCRERWHNHLRPDIRKEMWSEEEDKILIEAHMELGNRWAEIAKRLPGRTENTIKNHWNATKRKRYIKRKPSTKINLNVKGNSTSTVNESILLSKYIKSVERSEERKNGKVAAMDYGEPSSPADSKVYRRRFERKKEKSTAVYDIPDYEVYPSKSNKSVVKSSAKARNKGKVTEEVYEQSRGLFDLPDSEVYRPQFESSPNAWLASLRAAAAARKKQQDDSSVEATMGSSSSYLSSMYSEFNGYGNDTRLSLEMNGYMQEQAQSKRPDVDLVEMINNAKRH